MALSRRDLIRAAFAGGAFAWTLAQGPAKLWLPERRVLREAAYLIRVTPVYSWEGGSKGSPRELLILPNDPPQHYLKRDFAPGCQYAEVEGWELEDGREPRQIAMADWDGDGTKSTTMFSDYCTEVVLGRMNEDHVVTDPFFVLGCG